MKGGVPSYKVLLQDLAWSRLILLARYQYMNDESSRIVSNFRRNDVEWEIFLVFRCPFPPSDKLPA